MNNLKKQTLYIGKKGWLFTQKWNKEYFARIGLIPGNWLYYNKMWGYELETYIKHKRTELRRNWNLKSPIRKREGKNIILLPD